MVKDEIASHSRVHQSVSDNYNRRQFLHSIKILILFRSPHITLTLKKTIYNHLSEKDEYHFFSWY